MRIKMLASKRLARTGGGTLVFEAGSYYVTGGTDLSEEQATDWIMEGAAEDEAGVVVRPEPEEEPQPFDLAEDGLHDMSGDPRPEEGEY